MDRLIRRPELQGTLERVGRPQLLWALREVLADARRGGAQGQPVPSAGDLAAVAGNRAERAAEARPVRVINATGVVLHTNLGRALVSHRVAEQMARAMAGYSDLELDLATGRRSSRQETVGQLLCRLTGAEAALVVNNTAGATLLALAGLAAGGRVLVSRGELVEIGGGFRLPDVLAAGGAGLLEVGTTNRTYAADYRRALEATAPDGGAAMILRVHTSNFRITGFTHRPSLEELVALGREFGVPVVDDLGSGSLLGTEDFGLGPEPMVQASVAAGADAVTFSGDKLLGGPQAGVVVGKVEVVRRLASHPLARALRPGKEVFAGLWVTLDHYARGEARAEIPVWRMIGAPSEAVAARARTLVEAVAAPGGLMAVEAAESAVGGGSLPGETLPTLVVAIDADAETLARQLRSGRPPVVGRIEAGRLLLDLRTVLPEEDEELAAALRTALAASA